MNGNALGRSGSAVGAVVCAMAMFAAPLARADPPDLTIPVTNPGPGVGLLGKIVVHAINTGLGKNATGSTGFTPSVGDGTLGAAALGSGETGFDWLQIVTGQPAAEDPDFGPTPHVDPSLTRNGRPNPLSNGQPWYLHGRFLPPLTATFLPFSDLPRGLAVGDTISFDTYLVSFFPDNQYDVLAGFSWSDTETARGQPNTIAFHEITDFSPAYQQLVHSYGTTGWTYHVFDSGGSGMPEPEAWWLMITGIAGVGAWTRRVRAGIEALEARRGGPQPGAQTAFGTAQSPQISRLS